LGVEAVVYADQPKIAVVDKAVADAAFLLTPGQVSGPIQGALGFAVIKLTAVTPAKAATLESMRPQLEAELRAKAAAEKVYDLSQKYDDAHASGASLPEAAAKAGAPVISLGPISAQGLDRQGKPVTGVTPAILKRAFNLARGGESDVEEAGQGAYFAVKVEKVIPPALPALEEIKPQLVPYMMRQRIVERLKAKSDELVGRIRKGDAIETVAASVGSKVVDVAGLDRAGGAEQHKELGANFLGAVFNAKPGDVFVSPVAQGIAIAKLVSIQPGDPADIAKFTESGRPDVTLQVFQDLGGMTRQAAQTKLKTKSDLSRARLAIGLDPAEVKKLEDSAKPADKKK
jgi:peptidyl-prolyl cis-trans isomerase D